MVPSYSFLRGHTEGRVIEISEEMLRNLVALVVAMIPVDEVWYLKQYPDVANAVADGHFPSASDHYRTAGYFEDRFPREVRFDEDWYLTTYADVAHAVSNGVIRSAYEHFTNSGFKEGRKPSFGWSLTED